MTYLFGLLAGPVARYAAIGISILGILYLEKCSIENKAFKAGETAVIQKTQKVQNERIKKARRARNRVNSNSGKVRVRDSNRRD